MTGQVVQQCTDLCSRCSHQSTPAGGKNQPCHSCIWERAPGPIGRNNGQRGDGVRKKRGERGVGREGDRVGREREGREGGREGREGGRGGREGGEGGKKAGRDEGDSGNMEYRK